MTAAKRVEGHLIPSYLEERKFHSKGFVTPYFDLSSFTYKSAIHTQPSLFFWSESFQFGEEAA